MTTPATSWLEGHLERALDEYNPGPWHFPGGRLRKGRLAKHLAAGLQPAFEAREQKYAALLEANRAALAYNDSILGRAATGNYDLQAQGAIAEGQDLDTLYDDWMSKAKTAERMKP